MNDQEVWLALDVGSSAVKAWAFADGGRALARASAPVATEYPAPGQVQQDAQDWERAAAAALSEVSRQLGSSGRPVALGLTGQSPSVVGVDGGLVPVTPALTYADNRATAQAQAMSARATPEWWHRRTGHVPSAFAVAPKAAWLAEHGAAGRVKLWLQARDFIAARLTGVPATDPTQAAVTLVYDLERASWSEELMERAAVTAGAWPPVVPSHQVVGPLRREWAEATGLTQGLPVVLGAADSQSNLLGMGAGEEGQVSDMAGSSTCLNSRVPGYVPHLEVDLYPAAGLTGWETEVGLNTTGRAWDWVLRAVGREGQFAQAADLAQEVPPGSEGLLFLPFLADGERDDAGRQAGFLGLSLRHGTGHLLRAVLEGVALAIRWRLDTLREAGLPVRSLVSSGGGARLSLWNRIKADATGLEVTAGAADGAAVGAAVLAAMGVGAWPHGRFDHPWRPPVAVFRPDPQRAPVYSRLYERFLDAVKER